MDYLGFDFTPAGALAVYAEALVSGVAAGLLMVLLTLFYGGSRQ